MSRTLSYKQIQPLLLWSFAGVVGHFMYPQELKAILHLLIFSYLVFLMGKMAFTHLESVWKTFSQIANLIAFSFFLSL